MSVTITLDDNLVAQLQSQAEARNLSVAELALHILGEAVTNGGDAEWQACNQRRIELIRKQFAEGLRPDEVGELQQLQEMADQHLERFDERMLDDVKQLYSKAKRIVDASSG
jgi:predicted transcriptional regulator